MFLKSKYLQNILFHIFSKMKDIALSVGGSSDNSALIFNVVNKKKKNCFKLNVIQLKVLGYFS